MPVDNIEERKSTASPRTNLLEAYGARQMQYAATVIGDTDDLPAVRDSAFASSGSSELTERERFYQDCAITSFEFITTSAGGMALIRLGQLGESAGIRNG